MKMQTLRRRVLVPMYIGMLMGGCLFAGPCGITTLQFTDFMTSAIIRTGVTTLASALEAAVIEAAQQQNGAQP